MDEKVITDDVAPAATVPVAIDSYEFVTAFEPLMDEAIMPRIKTDRPQW
jgi:hypothetical protein